MSVTDDPDRLLAARPTGRGRPPDSTLRARLLAAAQTEFLLHGYSGARTDNIAARAGTSKMTLYKHFSSKQALLQASMNEPVIQALLPEEEWPVSGSPAEHLRALAARYLEAITNAEVISRIHLLHQDVAGGASCAFFESGPARAVSEVAALLRTLDEQGAFRFPEASIAAEQFLAMVRGNEHMRALLSLPPARQGASRDAYLGSCVAAFLRGHSASGPTGPEMGGIGCPAR